MDKQIRFSAALAFAIAMYSIPILATAEIDIDSIDVVGASLVYEEAGANVTVDFTCSPADGADAQVNINMSLTQRNGDLVAFGHNFPLSNTIDCTVITTDDGRHTQRFEFLVTSQLKIFSKGSAVVETFATLTKPATFETELIPGGNKEIQIVK